MGITLHAVEREGLLGTAGRSPARTGDRRRAGFSLIEILISFSLMLTVLFAFTRVLLSGGLASSTSHEATMAVEAARLRMEVLRMAEFEDVFALYNDDAADDPGGPGTAPGSGFAVAGLDALDGDPDGLPGTILFPVDAAAPSVLREDLQLPFLGLPRDLNGDAAVDANDHAADYDVLPVLVRVEWRSASGPARQEFRTLLGNL